MRQGNFTIHDALDVMTLAAYATVEGDIYIDAPGLTDLSLPSLCSVGGTIELTGGGAPDVATIALPLLRTVGSLDLQTTQMSKTISTPQALHTLALSSLETVTDHFLISGSDAYTVYNPMAPPIDVIVSLPHLTSVGTYLSLEEVAGVDAPLLSLCDELDLVDLGTYEKPGSVSIPTLPATSMILSSYVGAFDMSALASADFFLNVGPDFTKISFPSLVTAGSITIKGLVDFSAPALTTISGELIIDSASALELPNLESTGVGLGVAGATLSTLSLPKLSSTPWLYIGDQSQCWPGTGNVNLTAFDLPLLAGVPKVVFGSNPVLPACRADALVQQLKAVDVEYICPLAAGPCP